MKIKTILFLSIFSCQIALAQVVVNGNFNLDLSEDSLMAEKLEESLVAFLEEAQNRDFSDEYVDTTHLSKYEFFFHNLKGIGKSKNKTFHPPTIIKSYTFDQKNYFITVAFTGTKEEVPFVYKIVELKAVPYQNHFRFYCPFEERTAHFNTTTIKNVTYHYNHTLDMDKATAFANFKDELSELTQTPLSKLDYYNFQSLDDLLKSYGLLLDATKCNFLAHDLGFTDNQGQMYVTGTNNENYSFGYFGDYLYDHLPNRDNLYKPFVNGLSTYYGGYGLSGDNMEVLKEQFRGKLKENPNIDFLEEFKKGRKSSVHRHFSYFVMSAFLSEELIEKYGFDKALEVLYSGQDGALFFEKLKNAMDVDETNFHETIVRLIHQKSSKT